MKIKSIVIALTLGLSINAIASEPYGYSNNAGERLDDTAKYVVNPQKTVTNPTYTSTTYYQSTAGDRMFGWNGRVGNYSDAYHMGIDIWESPHMSNLGYTISKDYVTLPMPGLLVAKTNNHPTYGNGLVFLHPKSGINGKDIYSLYLHNETSNIHTSLVVGAFYGARAVSDGYDRLGYVQTIGKIGQTGSAFGIAHLHYELRYYPEWRKYNDIYALNSTDYNNRLSSHENPQTFKLNRVNFSSYIDEFITNISLNAYYERYQKNPNNLNECTSLFERATSEDDKPKIIDQDYVVSYSNSTCKYGYIGSNNSSNIESIIWKNDTRPRLKLVNNSSNSKYYTGLDRNDEINMSE
jgi:hypothetical protein